MTVILSIAPNPAFTLPVFFLQQMKDQLDTLLLTQPLLDDFKVRAGVSVFGGCVCREHAV